MEVQQEQDGAPSRGHGGEAVESDQRIALRCANTVAGGVQTTHEIPAHHQAILEPPRRGAHQGFQAFFLLCGYPDDRGARPDQKIQLRQRTGVDTHGWHPPLPLGLGFLLSLTLATAGLAGLGFGFLRWEGRGGGLCCALLFQEATEPLLAGHDCL